MKLKNFYLTDEEIKNLKYVSKILERSEGMVVRDLLDKHLRKFFPQSLRAGNIQAEKIRKYIFKKYRYKCAECGEKNQERKTKKTYYDRSNDKWDYYHTKPYSILEIHHKDKQPTNNLISNLVLLCRKCHKIADLKLRKAIE